MFMCMFVVVIVLFLSGSSGRRRGLNLDDLDDGLGRFLSRSSGLLGSGLLGSRLLSANSFIDRRDESRFRSSSFFLGDERRRLVAVTEKPSD